MRVKLAILAGLTLSLAATQCDHGPPSLFPSFLTEVTHHRNLSAGLPYVSGAKYFLNVMWAGNQNTDLVYLVRALPDGNRTLVILNGVLDPVGVYNLPEAGDMHFNLDAGQHLAGTCLVTIPGSGAPAVSPSPGFPTTDQCRDYALVQYSSGHGMFAPAAYNGSNTVLNSYDVTYSPSPPPPSINATGPTASVISAPNRVFALEGASSFYENSQQWACLILRDTATNEGYIFMTTAAPAPSVTPDGFRSMGRIVPGTVRFSADGRPVAEKPNGRLCRFSSDGTENDGTDTTDFHDYIVAYGTSDSMYLFKPSTGDLLKTRAWWRSPGY